MASISAIGPAWGRDPSPEASGAERDFEARRGGRGPAGGRAGNCSAGARSGRAPLPGRSPGRLSAGSRFFRERLPW